MGIPGATNPLLLASQGGYQVSRSLRFNSSDSGFCSRTFTSAGNRKTWTWAGWVKRGKMGYNNSTLFYCRTADSDTGLFQFRFGPSDRLDSLVVNGWATNFRVTNALFRDASAWYHIVLAFDSTQASDANRCKIYVNGVEQTFSTSSAFTQNADYGINQAATHNIGVDLSTYFDGYLADIHFIDGQALTPSSFTEVSATTGQLLPRQYTGSFGTNGFWLKFSDNSNNTATTLGKDYSPNGNNWTPNNLSVTAGAGNDSLVDTPTSYGTDTGAGSEVRGNYCTLNPLNTSSIFTLSNGNLNYLTATAANMGSSIGTIGVSSGKWYWEGTLVSARGSFGVARQGAGITVDPGTTSLIYYYRFDGNKYNNGGSAYGATYAANDVIGVALDLDAGTLTFYKNGVSQGTAFSSLPSDTYFPQAGDDMTSFTTEGILNFGQRPFAYTAPSGFKSLSDTSLPAPAVAKPNTLMDVALWSGTGATQSITFQSGLSPDFVWIKARNAVANHVAFDVIRGANKAIYPSLTNAEDTYTATLTSFNSSGFTLGYDDWSGVNASGRTYVGWCWDAGSSTVTNTQGSITSSVRANASAGFSIVTYTGNGTTGATVGHGLGVAPSFVIIKGRATTYNWNCYHKSIDATAPQDYFISMNLTDSRYNYTVADLWNRTQPGSTVFTLGSHVAVNTSSSTYVAYCFAPVAGYSSAFSIIGNGSSDGPFCFLGFRPRFIIYKRTDATANWRVLDTARDTYNVASAELYPSLSSAEQSFAALDILSNGFKLRNTDASYNASGGTYVGFAWAENPFQYARAR